MGGKGQCAAEPFWDESFNNSLFPFARALSSGVKTRKLPLIPCIFSLIQVSGSPLKYPSQVLLKVPSTEGSCCRQSVILHLQAAGSCWALQGNRLQRHWEEQQKKMPSKIYLSGENIVFLAASKSFLAVFCCWKGDSCKNIEVCKEL